MSNIYFDMETIPDQSPDALARILQDIKPPGNIKKPESIDKWMHENGQVAAEEKYHKTGLNGISGEICSIAWAIDDGEINGYIRRPGDLEGSILDAFFEDVVHDVRRDGEGGHTQLCWVGHNVIDFDLRFLKQRSIVTNTRPHFLIPAEARHGSAVVFDTMKAWGGWKGFVSQDALCKALGIEGKGDMTGADVWPAYQAGKYEEILAYNKDDVRTVRELFRRMSWA